jgi:hypothetical protein
MKDSCGFIKMGLQVCLELLCVLFEHTPPHEQTFVCSVIVLMEVGYDLESTPNIYKKLERTL